jgi:CRISPR/Cas system-associated endoribonuclease Cas2
MINLHDSALDEVIQSQVAIGSSNYKFALETLVPLIDRFAEQRKIQRPKFYERLQKDLITGCVMPPITLAFVAPDFDTKTNIEDFAEWVNANIASGYILDGMQRLNTLQSASKTGRLNVQSSMFLTIIVAKDYDSLLYRMITLNNGQKPMSVRHQVEMLTKPLLSRLVDDNKFENLSILSEKATEKASPQGSFKKSDIVSAYTAFLTKNVNNQSAKIIETKLDEILVGRMMENAVAKNDSMSFEKILLQVDRLSSEARSKKWFQNENNLIGFAVGASKSFDEVSTTPPADFPSKIECFEEAFAVLETSKINVGKMRRDLTMRYFSHFNELHNSDAQSLQGKFLEWTADE